MGTINGALKVHQAIANCLAENGVDTMFGVAGDANMFMSNSFVEDFGGKFVSSSHEVGAALMAIGYSHFSGKVGVCSVTFGPGMTNTITALVEGAKGTTPMLLITGEIAVEDRQNVNRLDTRGFATMAGAGYEMLRSARTVAEDIARALQRAVMEQRPIVFSLPIELDWAEAEAFKPIRVRLPDNRALVTESEDLDNAIGIIAAARRPIILAGRGATSPEAKAALIRLAKRIEAPLTTTIKAKDLFRGEDYDLGACGTVSFPGATETIIESDCIIAFGASLNRYSLSNGAFSKDKRIVQVNLQAAEIGKHLFPDAGLVGDPAKVADLIVHWLDQAEIPPSGSYTEELRQRLASDRIERWETPEQDNGTVAYLPAVLRLERFLPRNRVLVTDGGRFLHTIWQQFSVEGPELFLTPVNSGSIGLGMPLAIGAGHALPDRPVVLVTGDGGFMLGGLAEFNSAVRSKRDLIVIMCNDGSYGAEQHKFLARGLDPELSMFEWPDFAPVAIALGGEGATVRCEADWAAAEEAIRNRTKPVLIDIRIDPNKIAWDK